MLSLQDDVIQLRNRISAGIILKMGVNVIPVSPSALNIMISIIL